MSKAPGFVIDAHGIVHIRRYFKAPVTGCGLVLVLDKLDKTTKHTVTCMMCSIQAYGPSNLDT